MSLSGTYKTVKHKNDELFEEAWFCSHINTYSFCWYFDGNHSYNDPDDKRNRNSKENSWANKSKGREAAK